MFKIGLSHNFRFLICHDIFPGFRGENPTYNRSDWTMQHCTVDGLGRRLARWPNYGQLLLPLFEFEKWSVLEICDVTALGQFEVGPIPTIPIPTVPIPSVPTMPSQPFPQAAGESSTVTTVAQGIFLLLIFSSKALNSVRDEFLYDCCRMSQW